jgi:hypothetical protein
MEVRADIGLLGLHSMKMKPVHKALWKWAFLVCFACLPARAQDAQFLPEIDAHLKLTSFLRAYLQAKDDRDGGDPTQFTLGPSIHFYSKPLLRLKKITSFDLDDAKSRALVLETGYRYITAPGAPPEKLHGDNCDVPDLLGKHLVEQLSSTGARLNCRTNPGCLAACIEFKL